MKSKLRKFALQSAAMAVASVMAAGYLPEILPIFETAAVAYAAGTLSGVGTQSSPYLINNAADWETFAESVNNDGTTYEGQYIKLTANISVSKMVGTSSNKFKGTFDGAGHTITLNLSADGSEYTALFRYVNGATIKRLNTSGTVNGGNQKYAAGLIGSTDGTVNITACRSSVNITSSVSSDGTHGGFIGVSGGTVTFDNCFFDGSITGSNTTNCGGFVGWRNGTLAFNNCLMLGTMSLSSTAGSATFNRNSSSTLNNCYYKTAYGDVQGTQTSATGSALQTLLGNGWKVSGETAVPITDSSNLCFTEISGLNTYYLYTGSAINIGYTITAEDGTELTKGTDYTETITKSGSASAVQEKGDYILTISSKGKYSGSMTFGFTVYDGTPVTSATTEMTTGAYLVAENVSVDSRITIKGDVTLILGENATLTAGKGIEVSSGNSLTIEGSGTLKATGESSGDIHTAGIGSKTVGTIIINSGTIIATGGSNAAGIGGSKYNDNGGTIIINGGIVTANGGYYSTGLGGGHSGGWAGSYGVCGNININGGQVKARGGTSGSGIGAGYKSNVKSGNIVLGYTNLSSDSIDIGSISNNTNPISFSQGKSFVFDNTTTLATTDNFTSQKLIPACVITVADNIQHGSVIANKEIVIGNDADKTVTLTITPDIGYQAKIVKCNDTEITPIEGVYSFTVPDEDATITAEFIPDPAHFSVNESGTEYTIKTAEGWKVFCDCLQDNDTYNRFSGKTVLLDKDISVTEMAGSSGHDFMGTFDGQGHTLTVNYGSADNPVNDDDKAAPFRNVEGGCLIKNLHTAGTIYSSKKYASGIVGTQYGTVKIKNCRSSVTINSSTSGDGTHGGLVGSNGNGSGSNLTIEGCIFDGKILTVGETATTTCAGFVGCRNGTVNIINSIYAPAAIGSGETEVSSGATFIRNGSAATNCYYTRTLGDTQGKAAHTITAGENITIDYGIETETYSVSDIRSYDTGLMYNGNFYAGEGDEVALKLGYTGTPEEGYTFSEYTANKGMLADNTLTMPDDDVTVSAKFEKQKFTVTWKNGDTTLETDENVEYGTTPTYDGTTPTKTATAQYSYNFSGWSPAVSAVTGNATYMAQFDSTVNKYTVTWKNDDGTELEKDTDIPYGEMPEYNGTTPTKADDENGRYVFGGWDKDITTVTDNVTYTAQYTRHDHIAGTFKLSSKSHIGYCVDTINKNLYLVYLIDDSAAKEIANYDYVAIVDNESNIIEPVKVEKNAEYGNHNKDLDGGTDGKIHTVYKSVQLPDGSIINAEDKGAKYLVAFEIKGKTELPTTTFDIVMQ